MATDKLDIVISAKGADTATASLNKLDGALARLDKSLGRIQSANIDKIVSELNKFNSVKISKSLADNLNSLSGAISSLAYTPNVEKLGSIASAISKLNGVKVSTSVATSLDGVSEALNKVSDKSDTGGINDVIKSVTGLNGIKISKSVGSGIESIVDSVNNISEVKPVSTELATNLTTLGSSLQSFKDISGLKISSTLGKGIENIATGINNISEVKSVPPQLATNLTILGGALQSFAGLQGIQFSGVAQLTTALSKMGKIKPISNTIYDNVDKVAKAIQSLNTKLKDIDNDRLNALAKATKAIAPSMREADRETRNFGSGLKLLNLEAFINLASRAIDKMKEIARTTSSVALEYSKLENSMSFYNRSLGAHSNEQLKVLKRYAEVGALDMDGALQQIAAMNNMLTGFGHSSENAAKMSRILYQVAIDASFAIGENGKDVQAKFENLMSAMAGMPRVLYNWGVDTTITAMIDGFDDATRSMTKFEKSAYAYQIILNNTRAIQGQFSREYNLAATQQYVMQNKVKQSMAALGKAIQPFFLQMIKVGLVAVKVIDLIIMGLSRLFNFEYEPIDYDKLLGGMEASVEGAETAAGGVSDGLEGGAKAAKDIQKYLAGFDDLNVMTITKDTGGTGAGAVGGGGGVGGFDLGDYDLLGGLYDDMRDMFKEIDKDAESFYKKLKLIAPLALGIGAALLAWKVTTKFLTSLGLAKAGIDALKKSPGLRTALVVTVGLTLAIAGVTSMFTDGVNIKNTILTAIGLGLVGGEIGWKLGGPLGALAGITIGVGLSLVIAGITSSFQEGTDFGSVVTTIVGGLLTLGGLFGAFKLFNSKSKTGVPEIDTAGTNMESIGTSTSNLTGKLKTLAVNLGLGLVIISEVAIGAMLIVGSIAVLGTLLEQVGTTWEPLNDKSADIITGITLGGATLGAVGLALSAIGKGGGLTLATNMLVGVGILIEASIATDLFIIEIVAIGLLLGDVADAWKPINGKGKEIAKAITTGTGLLIGIGTATALLGAATIATGGILPIAIGLGTAMLVLLTASFKALIKSVKTTADQIKDLNTKLKNTNPILPTAKIEFKTFNDEMIGISTLLSEFSKNQFIMGIDGIVNSIVSFFAGSPIEKHANVVEKQGKDAKKLYKNLIITNERLRDAIRELKKNIELMEDLAKLQSSASGKKVVDGISSGIRNGIRKAGREVESATDYLVQQMQDKLEIHSPSRVMRKAVGYFMGLGIAEGVKDASGEVSKSVKGLTDVRFNGLDDNFISMLMGWKKSWLNAWKEMSESAGATLNGIGFATPSYDTKPMYQTVRRQGETTSGNGETLRAIAGEIIQAIYDSRTDEEDGDVVVELDGRVLGRFYDEHIKNKNARAGRTVVV